MDQEKIVQDMIHSAVKKAVFLDEYPLLYIFDDVRWAVIDLIEKGYVFEDYLYFRDEIEDEYEMSHTPEEWEEILKRAYKNCGFDYEGETKKREEISRLIGKELQKVMEAGDIVVNVTMDEVVQRALAKPGGEEDSDDMD